VNGRYQNQQMYRVKEKIDHPYLKKKDIIYLDGSHKNHLEVFRGSGHKKPVYCVLNFDGTLNDKKTMRAVNEGRFIEV
jgi:filamentous hemagglutinin